MGRSYWYRLAGRSWTNLSFEPPALSLSFLDWLWSIKGTFITPFDYTKSWRETTQQILFYLSYKPNTRQILNASWNSGYNTTRRPCKNRKKNSESFYTICKQHVSKLRDGFQLRKKYPWWSVHAQLKSSFNHKTLVQLAISFDFHLKWNSITPVQTTNTGFLPPSLCPSGLNIDCTRLYASKIPQDIEKCWFWKPLRSTQILHMLVLMSKCPQI
jgi:hypothetical protein